MNSSKIKRVMLGLMVITSGSLPGLACLSGAEQQTILTNLAATGSSIVYDNAKPIGTLPMIGAPANLGEWVWNGYAGAVNFWTDMLKRMVLQGVGNIVNRRIDLAIPDDPFPAGI